MFKEAELLYSAKDDIMNLLDFLTIIFFEKSKTNIKCAKAISIIEETKKKVISNNNFDMSVDYMLMKIVEECNG